MKRTDLVAGVRHVWALDKADVLAVVIYVGVYLASAVIVGAPWGWLVGVVGLGVVTLACKIYKRARDHREALLFHTWFDAEIEEWSREIAE